MKLAPHDADLVEADARLIYEQWISASWAGRGPPPPWDRAPDVLQAACRRVAANPYAHQPGAPGWPGVAP